MKPQISFVSSSRRGFTLIVTVSLMILLVILALGMLSLSSTALRSSAASSDMLKARQNARMALMLAIGQLQRHAGPDQRVTAPANIAGDAQGNASPPGAAPANALSVRGVDKGLSAVQPGTRYWTGVWRNPAPNPLLEILTATPSPTLQQWLVSGNESRTAADRLVPANPDYVVNPSGEVADATRAVVLVGTNTAAGNLPNPADRYVAAPLVEIRESSNNQLAGRYAWWVGDEGVKARINSTETSRDGNRYTSLPSQRRGWETVDGLSSYPTATNPNHAALARVTSAKQAELLMPDAIESLRANFHAATTDSLAVLTDPVSGGTKVDLTAIFGRPLVSTAPANAAGIANYPLTTSCIIPVGTAYPWRSQLRAPQWATAHTFVNRAAALTSSGELVVAPSTSINQPSIAPLITDFRILMGARLVPQGGVAAAQTATAFRVQPCGKIAIAIANPYSVPLRWNSNLEFTIQNRTPAGNGPSRIYLSQNNSPQGPSPDGTASFLPARPNRDDPNPSDPEPALFYNTFFQIPSGVLPPGEARVFTIGSRVTRPARDRNPVRITLVPFATANPGSFDNCLEMETIDADARTPRLILDVRESWQTTLAQVEMRLAGGRLSDQPLLRIESFEIDSNLDFVKGQRVFENVQQCREMPRPFGIQLFNLSISQPGFDYSTLFSGVSFDMGMRSSTIRSFADFNIRATRFTKPITCYNPPPYFSETSDSPASLPRNAPGGETGSRFTSNLLGNPHRWGHSPGGVNRTVLFTIPAQVTSLAQLQHADLTGDNDQGSIGHQPAYAFGNSYASPFIKRNLSSENRTNYIVIGINDQSGARREVKRFYDISYLLNASVWDTYFLSTIVSNSNSATPQIPAIMPITRSADPALKDPVLAATKLLVHGGFNVNSTDKNAWKAFLASAKHLQHRTDSSPSSQATFPRSLEQISLANNPPSGTQNDSFSGFRRLNDAQLDALATEICRQVRLRGPFTSVSQFVNRTLATLDNRTRALSRSGALQTAIDEGGLNINNAGNRSIFSAALNPTRDRVTFQTKNGLPRSDFDGPIETFWGRNFRPADALSSMPDWGNTSDGGHYGSVASIISDRQILDDPAFRSEQGFRSTNIPGWLTQADVLQVIGPSITARSDTFRIRTYGESINAAGQVVARAYCEAIVQRFPDYVDPQNLAHERENLSTTANELTPINLTYGRKFEIVSFRWLTPEEV
jgi:hypothetical protein